MDVGTLVQLLCRLFGVNAKVLLRQIAAERDAADDDPRRAPWREEVLKLRNGGSCSDFQGDWCAQSSYDII